MQKSSIPKSDMLEILSDRGADIADGTIITDVNLTEDDVEFSLEEKAEEEASSGG